MALLTQTELAVLAGQLPGDYLQWLRGAAFLSMRDFLIRVASAPKAERAAKLADALRTLQSPPGPEFDLAVARAQWSPVSASIYLAEPNIVAYHRGLTAPGPGQMSAFRALDVVWNPVAVVPSQRDVSFQTKLKQGVFDSVLEGTVVAGSCCGVAGAPTGAIAAGRVDGSAWTSVRAEPDLAKVGVEANTKARMATALESGAIVVAPSAAGAQPAVWWRVDKVSGQALAIGPKGWGQDASEHGILHALAVRG
jgi:hypothetical protein